MLNSFKLSFSKLLRASPLVYRLEQVTQDVDYITSCLTCPSSCSKVTDPGPELLVMDKRSPERVVVRKIIPMFVSSGNE